MDQARRRRRTRTKTSGSIYHLQSNRNDLANIEMSSEDNNHTSPHQPKLRPKTWTIFIFLRSYFTSFFKIYSLKNVFDHDHFIVILYGTLNRIKIEKLPFRIVKGKQKVKKLYLKMLWMDNEWWRIWYGKLAIEIIINGTKSWWTIGPDRQPPPLPPSTPLKSTFLFFGLN